MMSVSLDLCCLYRGPWRIDQGPAEAGAIAYHAILSGTALLENPAGGRPLELKAGDVLLLPRQSATCPASRQRRSAGAGTRSP
jgi:hypothetical protein